MWGGSNAGAPNTTVAWWAQPGPPEPAILDVLAIQPVGPVDVVLVNLGVNEMRNLPLPAEATWEANYWKILDAVHARYSTALVYLSYPWGGGLDTPAATIHGWIDTVIAARAFARAGDDEAVWAKAGDNGATNYNGDLIHFSPTGEAAKAAVMKTLLGY